jgi:trans-aconitate 2-methyltransferase
MTTWDPGQYERYKAYRDRPALDLMGRIPGDLAPRVIWDLGCGTGEQAAVLAARHPEARVYGLDSSAEMLERARARPARVAWVLSDINDFAPPAPPDLIFTNAALHWLDGHARLFPQVVATLAPGGVFACQIPAAHNSAAHQAMREVAGREPWAGRLAGAHPPTPVAEPEAYYDWLAPLCGPDLDIWTTTYLQALSGDDAVVDWMLGTTLRPLLEALADDVERAAFLADYRAEVAVSMPRRPDGMTLFPFPRLFMLARRR